MNHICHPASTVVAMGSCCVPKKVLHQTLIDNFVNILNRFCKFQKFFYWHIVENVQQPHYIISYYTLTVLLHYRVKYKRLNISINTTYF